MIADTYIKIPRVVVNNVQARIIPNIRVRREEKRRMGEIYKFWKNSRMACHSPHGLT